MNSEFTDKLEIENSGVRLMAANNTHIDVQGDVVLSFKLGELDLPTPALVSDCVSEIMLDVDFLADRECLWNFRDRTLTFNGHICNFTPSSRSFLV